MTCKMVGSCVIGGDRSMEEFAEAGMIELVPRRISVRHAHERLPPLLQQHTKVVIRLVQASKVTQLGKSHWFLRGSKRRKQPQIHMLPSIRVGISPALPVLAIVLP